VDDDIGDYEAFVASRAASLLRYGYVLTGNPHDAADLLQEGLVRLRTAWTRVRNKREPEAFVRTTMARLQISIWRRRRRESLVAEVPDTHYTDPSPEAAETSSRLWDALSTLPRKQRAVVVLRYYECLADEEIADVLRISRGTVRSQASRALEKLRALVALADEPTALPLSITRTPQARSAVPRRKESAP
jgi:RNA polymerase sigma-70 factor (sigma-E family)